MYGVEHCGIDATSKLGYVNGLLPLGVSVARVCAHVTSPGQLASGGNSRLLAVRQETKSSGQSRGSRTTPVEPAPTSKYITPRTAHELAHPSCIAQTLKTCADRVAPIAQALKTCADHAAPVAHSGTNELAHVARIAHLGAICADELSCIAQALKICAHELPSIAQGGKTCADELSSKTNPMG